MILYDDSGDRGRQHTAHGSHGVREAHQNSRVIWSQVEVVYVEADVRATADGYDEHVQTYRRFRVVANVTQDDETQRSAAHSCGSEKENRQILPIGVIFIHVKFLIYFIELLALGFLSFVLVFLIALDYWYLRS